MLKSLATNTQAAPLTTKNNKTYRISLVELTANNVGMLKQLNQVLFPVTYKESFYKEALEWTDLSRLGIFYC